MAVRGRPNLRFDDAARLFRGRRAERHVTHHRHQLGAVVGHVEQGGLNAACVRGVDWRRGGGLVRLPREDSRQQGQHQPQTDAEEQQRRRSAASSDCGRAAPAPAAAAARLRAARGRSISISLTADAFRRCGMPRRTSVMAAISASTIAA